MRIHHNRLPSYSSGPDYIAKLSSRTYNYALWFQQQVIPWKTKTLQWRHQSNDLQWHFNQYVSPTDASAGELIEMPKAAVLNRQSDIDSSQQLQFTFCYTVFPVFLTCGRIVKSCSRSQPNLTEIWRRPASPGVRCDQIFNSPATQNCTCSFSGNSLDNETTLILIHSLLDSQWKCSNQISIPRANYWAQIIVQEIASRKHTLL